MTKSMSDRLDIEVEGWRPDPGDKVEGVIVGIDTRMSDYNDTEYPVLELELDDGTGVMVHGFHTTLKNEIAQKKPNEGDRIGIKYLGKKIAKRTDAKGKPVEFEAYKVLVERATGDVETPDWDSMEKHAGEQVAAETGAPATDYSTEEEPF